MLTAKIAEDWIFTCLSEHVLKFNDWPYLRPAFDQLQKYLQSPELHDH